jgi:hypothetical protein
MDHREVPNPDIPENAWIATGTDPLGQTVKVAGGSCMCGEDRVFGDKFRLLAGQQWVCPVCARTYSFDGERIEVAEPNHI